ncbi:hypothetical protein MFIFM68171_11281 [Madurella fahalii]|uniref:Zn(2)-C6 fungal-type domain-containing protein n=1 Tax=Madurella fahalii TaxID=1157608 RepID=A0ABQ0GTK0_9PEZI
MFRNTFANMPASDEPNTSSLPAHHGRPKRSQVSRACDWCRVHRVKCDDEQPCRNCRSRGGQCRTAGTGEIRSLPHAFREIERLKRRIRELEQEVERRNAAAAVSLPNPNQSSMPAVVSAPTVREAYNLRREGGGENQALPGFYISNGHMPQKQWFGPSSLFYFIGRITSHLAAFIEQPPAEYTIHFSSTGMSFTDGPGLESTRPTAEPATDGRLVPDGYTYSLTAMQEEYFLGLFWQSFHGSFQIVDEGKFKEHYKSLWSGHGASRTTRKPSALVDIILALCMLSACPPRSDRENSDPATDSDATAIAGRWHYQRCQTQLISELESPSLSTLQCHIFSVIYLCCASFQNMAHSTLALAMRTAQILGLHLEPPPDLPRPERELRKRLWWTLYALESKTCMKLGRPWSGSLSETSCSLPADDHQLAIESGSATLASGNVTWLTYTLQQTKLVLAARDVYLSFYGECPRVLGASKSSSIHDDPAALESCAAFLRSSMAHLDSWVRSVPDGLRNERKRGGEPFSTDPGLGASDTLSLAIETFAPSWLQRQRLLTELLYHHLCVILYRPMISFSAPGQSGPATDAQECAMACARHAITLTQITHQALSETGLLENWHEAFQWQWNAAITMIGFVLATPPSPTVQVARTAIDLAIEGFEIFGRHFAVGTRAVKIVGELMGKVESLIGYGGRSQGEATDPAAAATDDDYDASAAAAAAVAGPVDTAWPVQGAVWPDGTLLGPEGAGLQDVLTGTMDVAFSVDSFNSFEWLQGGSQNFGDLWTFPT